MCQSEGYTRKQHKSTVAEQGYKLKELLQLDFSENTLLKRDLGAK